MDDFSKKEQRLDAQKRGALLTKLYLTDPNPLSDKELLVEMTTDYPEYNFTLLDIRRALKYLDGHELAKIQLIGSDWAAMISSKGVDYSQGVGDAMQGVFRG